MLTQFSRIPSDPSRCLVSINTKPYSSFIAKGGFGSVYLYKHPIDGKEYAIKRIRIHSPKDQITAFREIQLLSCLYHPHIIRYHTSWLEEDMEEGSLSVSDSSSLEEDSYSDQRMGFFQTKYVLCCQMEYCSSTLSDYLEFRNQLNRIREIQIQKEILEAIEFLHQQNIIHGDITPKNILLTYYGQVKLSDFGLSIVNQQSISDGQMGGRSVYQAPEMDQILEKELSPSLDIFNIGMILIEMNQQFKTRMEIIHCFRKWKRNAELLPPFLFMRSYILHHIQYKPSNRWTSSQSLTYIKEFQKMYLECKSILENNLYAINEQNGSFHHKSYCV